MMDMGLLFEALADALDSSSGIERAGQDALREAAKKSIASNGDKVLPDAVLSEFREADAHPVCEMIARAKFDWSPPQTSKDPAYIADSKAKLHVELIGPDGLVLSNEVRLGLYGILPHNEYGIRTHLAEEVFVMLAGEADWKQGDSPYAALRSGERAYHPSMMPHATRTRDHAFMSVYIWRGDVSTDSYKYFGKS